MMMNVETTPKSEARRVGRFGLAGVINTLVDYVFFITFTKVFSLPLSRVWVAKFFSGAIAMAVSFELNRSWVFKSRRDDRGRQAAQFVLVSVIGSWGIQLGFVQLFSSVVPQPGEWAFHVVQVLGVTSVMPAVLTEAFIIKTVAFGLATLASLTWNYFGYKKVVFS